MTAHWTQASLWPEEPFQSALDCIPRPRDTQISSSSPEHCDFFNMPPLQGSAEGKPGGRIALKGLSKDNIRELRNKGEVSCAECRR